MAEGDLILSSCQVTEGSVDEIIRPRPQGSSPVYEYVTEGASFGLPVSLLHRQPQAQGRLRCAATGDHASCIPLCGQLTHAPVQPHSPATAVSARLSSLTPGSFTGALPSAGQDTLEMAHLCMCVGNRPRAPVCDGARDMCTHVPSLTRRHGQGPAATPGDTWGKAWTRRVY